MKDLHRAIRPFYATTWISIASFALSILFGTGLNLLIFSKLHETLDNSIKGNYLSGAATEVAYFCLVTLLNTLTCVGFYTALVKFRTRGYPGTYLYCFKRRTADGSTVDVIGYFFLQCAVNGQVSAQGESNDWKDGHLLAGTDVGWESSVVAATVGAKIARGGHYATCYILYSVIPEDQWKRDYRNGLLKFQYVHNQHGIVIGGDTYDGDMQALDASTIWEPAYAERVGKGYLAPDQIIDYLRNFAAALINRRDRLTSSIQETMNSKTLVEKRTFSRPVITLLIVSALGYFVDVYDLIIFSVVRSASLAGLGVPPPEMLSVGLRLLNIQLAGVLAGGILWGILGDKRGRLSVLFGSIILYSAANIANAYVATIGQYELLRFVAGFGLAGELGAGVTIVSEFVGKKNRGWATMFIASVGLLGAVLASQVGIHFDWRTSFLVGGILGLALLVLRMGAIESSLFLKVRKLNVPRGNFSLLFRDKKLLGRYVLCVLAGAPLYFVIGILITASPEFGRNEGLSQMPVAGVAVMYAYIAMSVGDLACSALSQWWHSRRWALTTFHLLCLAACCVFILVPSPSVGFFNAKCAAVGFSIGFWAVLILNAAEQFGTNLRASVTTSVPNFVRALLIPISAIFTAFRSITGLAGAALILAVVVCTIAIAATWRLEETFDRELDFVSDAIK
ncbi:MAG TPA: MFS transporter [Chthoniobacterales bacterium]|jgi:putative MFS transporter|nr:MFS transporter [Chthoniobacterales bacterium]